jgi:hypothetical protein
MNNQELPQASAPEQHLGKELFDSFCDSLKLVSAVERLYASKVLRIDPDRLNNPGSKFELHELKGLSEAARALFYSPGERREKYDEITNQAISVRAQDEPDKYVALEYPELLPIAKDLARQGLLFELSSRLVDGARVKLHSGHVHSRRQGHARKELNQAARVDDLIVLNHAVRDFIEQSTPRLGTMTREKLQRILGIMLGDRERAKEIEVGVSLEVAAKRAFDRILPGASEYGNVKQDKAGGDIVLFPRTEHEVFVNLKQTPPHELRDQVNPEQMDAPGFFWKDSATAYLWLGYDGSVGNSYGVPAAFLEVAARLAAEARPELAVA